MKICFTDNLRDGRPVEVLMGLVHLDEQQNIHGGVNAREGRYWRKLAFDQGSSGLADKVRTQRSHGPRVKHYNEVPGVSSRLDERHGAALSVKLRPLDA